MQPGVSCFDSSPAVSAEEHACLRFLQDVFGVSEADMRSAWGLRSFSLLGLPPEALTFCRSLSDHYWAWDGWVLEQLQQRGVQLRSTDVSLEALGRLLLVNQPFLKVA